ncbi:MAG: hypothetical protein E7051_05410 [Lentisphaerae bacterium]|nr:hypothetical protein [Lentisphaerota bacterium]
MLFCKIAIIIKEILLKMKRIVICLLTVFASFLLTAAPKGTVNGDKVNLRQGAGLKFPVVGRVVNGQSVEITRVIGSWLEIAVPENLTAYVSEARINPDGTLSGELNMRTAMSSSAPILGVLPKGTKVERLDKRANGWVKIKVPASSGVKVYLAAFLVTYNSAEFDEKGNPVSAQKPAEVKPAEKAPEAPAEKPAEVKPAEKPAEVKPAVEKKPAEKLELQGVLVKWKYSTVPETAYALLTEKDGFNQAFVTASDSALLVKAENKKVKVSGVSAGRYGDNGAIILKADVISVL